MLVKANLMLRNPVLTVSVRDKKLAWAAKRFIRAMYYHFEEAESNINVLTWERPEVQEH